MILFFVGLSQSRKYENVRINIKNMNESNMFIVTQNSDITYRLSINAIEPNIAAAILVCIKRFSRLRKLDISLLHITNINKIGSTIILSSMKKSSADIVSNTYHKIRVFIDIII